MSGPTDSPSQLIDRPLQPLRPEWLVPERVEALRVAPALPDPDAYRECVARQQRRRTTWHAVRSGYLKIMRRLLRDLVEHDRPTGGSSAMADPAALDVVASAVRK